MLPSAVSRQIRSEKGQPLRRRHGKSRGIEDNQPFHSLGMTHRPSQANEPSPVVDDKRDVACHAKAFQQGAQVAYSLFEIVGVSGVVRLVRKTTPDVIGRDDPIRRTQIGKERSGT